MHKRKEVIGDCELYLGNSLEIIPELEMVDHVFGDPPYEESLHASKSSLRVRVRSDSGPDLKGLNFDSINSIRSEVVKATEAACRGWVGYFCTVEGVAPWADEINASSIKYKRACVWVKPDSTPQLNGQGPAQGAEMFVTGWNGQGHAKWNSGGKRGVYTHCVNQVTREGTHPTEKPISLMREILTDFTNAGETILDPFMGSGTTGVACVQLQRKFIGIELNETYFDISCKRIEEAYRQPQLFPVEKPKPAKTRNLFDA
tara:strand:- start:27441 stop:28217 length:777 start_codon:yes stop_codon:yes gene_type:complete